MGISTNTDEHGLTRKERLFADQFLLTGNKAGSAKAAGFSAKGAGVYANRLLRKAAVQKYVTPRRQEIVRALDEAYSITKDRVLRELAAIAFCDIRKMHDESGDILPVTKMDEMTRRAIASVDVKELVNADGDLVGYIRKIKLASKVAALELIGRHLGMWGQNNGSEGSILNINIIKGVNQLDHPDYLKRVQSSA
jgi:phage terminase small subunit